MQLFDNKSKAIFKIINSYFWKTKIGPIFSVALPFGMMLIYFLICEATKWTYFFNSFTLFLSIAIMPLSVLTIPAMNLEFKKSIILRKIKTNNVGAIKFTIISFIYYFSLNIISVCITFLFAFVFLRIRNPDPFQWINWPSMIYSLFMLIILSISFGSALAIFVKNSLNSQIIGFSIILFSLILSGQILNVYVISNIDALKILALFSPPSYAMCAINISSLFGNNNDIFNFNTGFTYFELRPNGTFGEFHLYDSWQKVMFAVGPWVWVIILQSINISKFKWISR